MGNKPLALQWRAGVIDAFLLDRSCDRTSGPGHRAGTPSRDNAEGFGPANGRALWLQQLGGHHPYAAAAPDPCSHHDLRPSPELSGTWGDDICGVKAGSIPPRELDGGVVPLRVKQKLEVFDEVLSGGAVGKVSARSSQLLQRLVGGKGVAESDAV